jgi:hypothetical protein
MKFHIKFRGTNGSVFTVHEPSLGGPLPPMAVAKR